MRRFFSTDAILRTTWRMLVTEKRLLEWNPSGDADRNSRTDLAGSFRTMWIAPVIAVARSRLPRLSGPVVLCLQLCRS